MDKVSSRWLTVEFLDLALLAGVAGFFFFFGVTFIPRAQLVWPFFSPFKINWKISVEEVVECYG